MNVEKFLILSKLVPIKPWKAIEGIGWSMEPVIYFPGLSHLIKSILNPITQLLRNLINYLFSQLVMANWSSWIPTFNLRSQIEWRIMWKTSNRFGGELTSKCLLTCSTLLCILMYCLGDIVASFFVHVPRQKPLIRGGDSSLSFACTATLLAPFKEELITMSHCWKCFF
jgi:hypothetical protein